MFSIAGIDIITIMGWSKLMKWAGKNVSDDPKDIPTLASMLFGDDWEDEMAGLKALRRDVNYLIRNANGRIPKFLEALKDNVNREIKVAERRRTKTKSKKTKNNSFARLNQRKTLIRNKVKPGKVPGRTNA